MVLMDGPTPFLGGGGDSIEGGPNGHARGDIRLALSPLPYTSLSRLADTRLSASGEEVFVDA